MNNRTVKAMRKQARGEALAAVKATAPVIRGVYDNEQITRKRVDELERGMDGIARAQAAATAFRSRTFFGRMQWLFTGR